jgi:hypothetical protein
MRADVAYVRALAENGAAIGTGERSGYGIPMTEAEQIELSRRTTDFQAIATEGHAYGLRNSETFAGDFIDQERRLYVFRVTDDPDGHLAALKALLPLGSPVVVERVRWSLAELEPLVDRVIDAQAFYQSLGIRFIGAGVITEENLVELTVGSQDHAIESLILGHFGNDPALRVRFAGTGLPAAGFGTVTVELVDRAHAPITPSGVLCQLATDDPRAWSTDDVELAPIDSHCRFTHVGVSGVEARIVRDDATRKLLASGRGVIRDGAEVTITVVVDQ